jgi:hypothetical protein
MFAQLLVEYVDKILQTLAVERVDEQAQSGPNYEIPTHPIDVPVGS